jgi:hypothetical protein
MKRLSRFGQEKYSMRTILALAATAAAMLAMASTAAADLARPVGGLDLTAYCQANGFQGASLPRGQLAHHAAVQNWRCASVGGESQPINMTQACKWEYGDSAHARFTDVHDAYTWACYSVASE